MNRLSKSLIASLVLCATAPALAECYYTSATTSAVPDKIDEVDNVIAMHGNNTCTVSARVSYKRVWYNIVGRSTNVETFKNTEDLCFNALEMGIRDFLFRMSGKRISAQQQTVCTDLQQVDIKPVQVGDVIKVSEVQPHPTRKQFINQDGHECRWFIEALPKAGEMLTASGVICRVGRLDADKWLVVDKRLTR